MLDPARMRRHADPLAYVFAFWCARALAGCGGCPPNRSEPAHPERTEVRIFVRSPSGEVTTTTGDPSAPAPVPCESDCQAAFDDSSMPCASVCAQVWGTRDVRDCSFDPDRTTLRCMFHYPAEDERCSCDLYDC